MPEIFISHRPADAPGHVGRLFDSLESRFGASNVLIDVEPAEPGDDTVAATKEVIAACDVLLAVIGDDWMGVRANSDRSVDDPSDPVRTQLESAFQSNVKVIPVLIEGAHLPHSRDLPPSISRLARCRALHLTDSHWRQDITKLFVALESSRFRGRARKIVTGNRGARAVGGAFEAIRTSSTAIRVVRVLIAVITIAAAAISGISLFGGDDGPKQERSYKRLAPLQTDLILAVPNDWTEGRRTGNGVTLLPPGQSQPVRVTVDAARAGHNARTYAQRTGATYRRSLPGYRQLELGAVDTWEDGYQRIFIFDAGSAARLSAGVDRYYADQRRTVRASGRAVLSAPVEERLRRLRADVSAVKLVP